MKYYQKFLSIFSLALLLTLAVTGLASADVLHGAGELYAKGSGVAKLHMTGTVDIEGQGVGIVYIRDADEIRATGEGRRVNQNDNVVIFYGYSGKIHVSGENMTVNMLGKKIEFKAEGQGTARLHGRGIYETGSGRTGDWAPDGLDLELAEE